MDEEISNLFKAISERDEMIMKLEQRISALEYQYDVMNSLMFVRDRVIENLRLDLTRLQQYTRRPNVSVFGIPKEDNEKPEQLKQKVENLVTEINSEITMANIDKFHRDGPSNGDDQSVIIKFKSHESKEIFFKEGRKHMKEKRNKVKIKPNLCPERKRFLNQAIEFVDSYPDDIYNPPDFVYADVHGIVRVKMKHRTKIGMFFEVSCLQDVASVIQKAQTIDRKDPRFDREYIPYDINYNSGWSEFEDE
jgi:hypothetical protein